MIMGAMSGLSSTFLPAVPWLASRPFYSGLGAVLAAAGLARLGGWYPASIVLAGQALAYWGPNLVREWLPGIALWGVDMNFAFRYSIWFVAMVITVSAFVPAYRTETRRTAPIEAGARPALVAD